MIILWMWDGRELKAPQEAKDTKKIRKKESKMKNKIAVQQTGLQNTSSFAVLFSPSYLYHFRLWIVDF